MYGGKKSKYIEKCSFYAISSSVCSKCVNESALACKNLAEKRRCFELSSNLQNSMLSSRIHSYLRHNVSAPSMEVLIDFLDEVYSTVQFSTLENLLSLASTLILSPIDKISSESLLTCECKWFSHRMVGFALCSVVFTRISQQLDSDSTLRQLYFYCVSYITRLLPVCQEQELKYALKVLTLHVKNGSHSLQHSLEGIRNVIQTSVESLGILSKAKDYTEISGNITGFKKFLVDISSDQQTSSDDVYATWQVSELCHRITSSQTSHQDLSLVFQYAVLWFLLQEQHCTTSLLRHSRVGDVTDSTTVEEIDIELVSRVLCLWQSRAEDSFSGQSACQCSGKSSATLTHLPITELLLLSWESVVSMSILSGQLVATHWRSNNSSETMLLLCLRYVCQVNELRYYLRQCVLILQPVIKKKSTLSPVRNIFPGIENINNNSNAQATDSWHQLKVIETLMSNNLKEIPIEVLSTSLLSLSSVKKEGNIIPERFYSDAGLELVSQLILKLQDNNSFSPQVYKVADLLVYVIPKLCKMIEDARVSENEEPFMVNKVCRDCRAMISDPQPSIEVSTLCGHLLRLDGLKLLLMNILLFIQFPCIKEHLKTKLWQTLPVVFSNLCDESVVALAATALSTAYIAQCNLLKPVVSRPVVARQHIQLVVSSLLWRSWCRLYAESDRVTLGTSTRIPTGLHEVVPLLSEAIHNTAAVSLATNTLKSLKCSDIIGNLFQGCRSLSTLSSVDILWFQLWNVNPLSESVYILCYVIKSVFRSISSLNKNDEKLSLSKEHFRQLQQEIENVPQIYSMQGKRAALREDGVLNKLEQVSLHRSKSQALESDTSSDNREKKKRRKFAPLITIERNSYYLRRMLSTIPAVLVRLQSEDNLVDILIDTCVVVTWTMQELGHVITSTKLMTNTGVYKEFIIFFVGFGGIGDICTVLSVMINEFINTIKTISEDKALVERGEEVTRWLCTVVQSVITFCQVVETILCISFPDELPDSLLGGLSKVLRVCERGLEILRSLAADKHWKCKPISATLNNYRMENDSFIRENWDGNLEQRVYKCIDKYETM